MDKNKIIVRIDPDLKVLIPGFLQNCNTNLLALREALQTDDYETIRSLGHKLRGVGGGYGFDELTEIGRKIESAVQESRNDTIPALIDTLSFYLENVEVTYNEH